MGKIKVNLASGNVVEKPLITCFKSANGSYIVLDNEANGTMGLPIICVSKFSGTSAEKIFDQNEWIQVKENLKSIIAGNPMEYLSVPGEITAQDDFFTQLTLPIASFDLIKSKYAPVEPSAPVEPVTVNPVSEVTQVEPVMPSIPDATPVMPEPTVANEPVPAPTPIQFDMPVSPAMPEVPTPSPVQVESPLPEVTVENTPLEQSTPEDSDLKAIKDNFMKACENMFDALIKKFENK